MTPTPPLLFIPCPACGGRCGELEEADGIPGRRSETWWSTCGTCKGTGDVPNPALHCACCAAEGETTPLVDGACPPCVDNECGCVAALVAP